MPTTITSAGITFNDATSLTSAVIPANAVGATQIANGSVTAAKLGTTEQKQIAKAWVNFDGTTSPGTIRSSYNVSSVTKNGTGDYTVNFATALADANYSAVTTGRKPLDGFSANLPSFYNIALNSGNVRVASVIIGNNGSDSDTMSVQIFGN